MKLLLLFAATLCLQAHADSYGQTITLKLRNATLEKVFAETEKQSNYRFVYTKEEIATNKTISIEVRNVSIYEVLRLCLKDQGLSYSIQEPYIIIKKTAGRQDRTIEQTSNTIIKGRVMNDKGEGIAGATVTVKGTSIATACDENGYFSIEFDGNYTTLVISSIGYGTKEISIKGLETVAVTLETSVSVLDETLVIAYGNTTRRLNTGSVGKVGGEEISKQPISNVLSGLHGKVSGLVITQSSGVPGSSVKVQIRGRNSLVQGSEPLFIVDGVPFAANNSNINNLTSVLTSTSEFGSGLSPFAAINPEDIESIEILKDADATAIYGSRGANGVVMITTKRGREGKLEINGRISGGVGKVTRNIKMMNSPQYLEMRREAFNNDGITPNSISGTLGYAPDLLLWDTSRNTDFKELLMGGSAHQMNAQISLKGGTKQTHFFLSGSYNYETTVFPGDLSNKRGTGNVAINHNSIDKKFLFDVSTNYSSSKNQLSSGNGIYYSISLPPMINLYDSSGNLNWQMPGFSFQNPLAFLLRKYLAETENLISKLNLEYRVTSDITLRTSLGFNKLDLKETYINPIKAQNPAFNPKGSADFSTNIFKNWIVEPQVEYRKTTKLGTVNLLGGLSLQETINDGFYVSATGYSDDALIESLGAAPLISSKGSNYSKYRYAAIFGRINYNWDDKYLLNLTGRRDGSSRFGNDRQFANFGSVGVGWIFSREKFINKKSGILSFGKVRASYGVTGNDQIGDYKYLDLWRALSNTYQGSTALVPDALFNPDYSWEKNKKFEIGLEAGILKNKLFVTVAYYVNKSEDQLIAYRLPTQTGFNNITKNFQAVIRNTGLETEISSNIISSTILNWKSSLNFTFPQNRLLSFPDLSTSSYSSTYQIGQSINLIYKLHSIGVDPATGIFQFEDANKDGNISRPDDYMAKGSLDPKFYGGFSNSIEFKKINFDFLFEFRKQIGRNYLYSLYTGINAPIPGTMNNHSTLVLDRWQKPGDQSYIQKFTATNSSAAYQQGNIFGSYADGVFSDASYIRLKTLSVSYILGTNLSRKIGVTSLRIFFQGQNLLTITEYKGGDPESQYLYGLPPLKVFTSGIKLTL